MSDDTHAMSQLPEDQKMSGAGWIERGVRASDDEIERLQPRWDIPSKVAITADLGHHLTHSEVVDEAISSLDAGASAVHMHILEEDGQNETNDLAVWKDVVGQIRDEYPNAVIDGGFRGETFDEQMSFIREGLFDVVSFGRVSNPEYLESAFDVMAEHDAKPKIGVFNSSYIQRRKALYVDTDIIKSPSLWSINPGNPYEGLPFADPDAMVQALLFMTRSIREADPDAQIMCTAAGRYSSYVSAQAAILGHHMRVGMGETRWRHPHTEETLKDNKTAIEDAASVARGVGREPATPSEYREMLEL